MQPAWRTPRQPPRSCRCRSRPSTRGRPRPHFSTPCCVRSERRGCISTRSRRPPARPGNVSPLLDDGPMGLEVAYALTAGGFHILANGDHLAAWSVSPATLRETAFRNLEAWSGRRILVDRRSRPAPGHLVGHRRRLGREPGSPAGRDRLPRGRARRFGQSRAGRPAGAPPAHRGHASPRRPGVRPPLRGLHPRLRRRFGRGDRSPHFRAARRPGHRSSTPAHRPEPPPDPKAARVAPTSRAAAAGPAKPRIRP